MPHLIIPDIHENVGQLRKILDQHGSKGRPVLLGDLFDSLVPQSTTLTLKLLDELLQRDALICLGNHDAHYLYNSVRLRCSGYSMRRSLEIHQHAALFKEWKNRAKLYHEVDGWMLSHAGFHTTVLREATEEFSLPEASEQALSHADLWRGDHILLAAGHARGGFHPVGGPMWLDWNDFEPVEGMKQIVGHTTAEYPRWNGQNLCLDTGLRHVGLLDGGTLEVIHVPS